MQKNFRPFLKWPGNKFRILNTLKPILPKASCLCEPFVGSAAVFLNSDYSEYYLADSNPDLIATYQFLKQEGEKFINYVWKFFTPKYNTKSAYYDLRQEFNETKIRRRKAAIFIYLNRHGYNGLCRYNKSGSYNVPFGSYVKPYMPAAELLNFYHKSASVKLKLACVDFRNFLKNIKLSQAVIYCDPPYVSLNQNNTGFTQYFGGTFSWENQVELANFARQKAEAGNWVILSNHDLPIVRELFWDAELLSFPVSRFINCKKDGRLPVQEILAIYRPKR